MKHALIYNEQIVRVYDPSFVGRVAFGDGDAVSPSIDGWSNDSGYRIAAVVEAGPVPEGQVETGRSVEMVDGAPVEIIETEAAQPAPSTDRVTSRQFFLQLDAMGLLTAVEAWVEQQPRPIRIAFDRSSTFVRDDAMLQQGFAALEFEPEQIDGFFTAAAGL